MQREDKDDWMGAIQEEIECMHENKVWELVERTPDMNVIANRWIFKIKTDPRTGKNIYRAR